MTLSTQGKVARIHVTSTYTKRGPEGAKISRGYLMFHARKNDVKGGAVRDCALDYIIFKVKKASNFLLSFWPFRA